MAITPVWIEGWEHGVVSISGTGIINAVNGAPTASTTVKRTGARALLCATSSDTEFITKNIAGSPTCLVWSGYIYFDDLPSADSSLVVFLTNAAGDQEPRLRFESSDSTFQAAIGTTMGNKSSPISADTWYRVDIKSDVSANPSTIDIQIDGVAIAQLTLAQAATTFYAFQIGLLSSCNCNMYVDDIVASITSGDYPIGAHSVELLAPTGEGTHNAGTVIKDNAGNVIDGSTYLAYDDLDEIPPDGAAYIQQDGSGSGNYAEVTFSDTTNTNILGASAFLSENASGDNADNGQFRIRDSAGQETTIYSGSHAGAALKYKMAIITAPAAGWSQTTANGLRGRVGYSTDVDSIPYWDALGVQLLYGVAVSTAEANVVMNII